MCFSVAQSIVPDLSDEPSYALLFFRGISAVPLQFAGREEAYETGCIVNLPWASFHVIHVQLLHVRFGQTLKLDMVRFEGIRCLTCKYISAEAWAVIIHNVIFLSSIS